MDAGQDTPRSADEVRRHEAHLVGQIYHLIDQNRRLEEQLDRLARVTEIAELFRERRISRDTYQLPPLVGRQSPQAEAAWLEVRRLLDTLPEDHEILGPIREALGIIRERGWEADGDWLAEARGRLLAAEQAVAFLDEQSREMDLLKEEKNAIQDGASRLEQTIEDLWKALNEKTTHIQGLEAQLTRIRRSLPYRAFRKATRPLRGGKP